jgi:hypothetical protein
MMIVTLMMMTMMMKVSAQHDHHHPSDRATHPGRVVPDEDGPGVQRREDPWLPGAPRGSDIVANRWANQKAQTS